MSLTSKIISSAVDISVPGKIFLVSIYYTYK